MIKISLKTIFYNPYPTINQKLCKCDAPERIASRKKEQTSTFPSFLIA
jgi:hypothetical protein